MVSIKETRIRTFFLFTAHFEFGNSIIICYNFISEWERVTANGTERSKIYMEKLHTRTPHNFIVCDIR